MWQLERQTFQKRLFINTVSANSGRRCCSLLRTKDMQRPIRMSEAGKQKLTSNSKLLIGSTAIVAMLALVIHAVSNSERADKQPAQPVPQPSNAQHSSASFTAPQYEDHTDQIVSASFTVEPRQWRYFKFTVSGEMQQARVVGRFNATGGGGNDIEVFVTNEDGYTNLANGHRAKVWYESGKVTVSEVSTGPLPPGKFYLIFNNRFSLITNKAVNAKIELHYQALRRNP